MTGGGSDSGARAAKGSRKAPGRPSGCPICGKPPIARHRPFCSRRCADIDLGRWLDGRYAIPTDEPGGGVIEAPGEAPGEVPDEVPDD